VSDPVILTPPLTDEDLIGLRSGDRVFITGTLLTGRDAAHKRLVDLIEKGENLPVDLEGQVIYFVGPTPTRPGEAIGSAGPTTSYRMDAYSPILIERGLKGMIGKGSRSRPYILRLWEVLRPSYHDASYPPRSLPMRISGQRRSEGSR
jgi:fumarate hydratase subunit beta